MKRKAKASAFTISIVAERYGVHPQTLRFYERQGLLAPSRSEGNTRLYTEDDLERLELILGMTRDLGVNLAGVEVVLNMREKMLRMQEEISLLLEALQREFERRGEGDGGSPRGALVKAPRRTILRLDRQGG